MRCASWPLDLGSLICSTFLNEQRPLQTTTWDKVSNVMQDCGSEHQRIHEIFHYKCQELLCFGSQAKQLHDI